MWFVVPLGILGLVLDQFWATLAVGLLALIFWHYFYQYKLVDWLWHRRTMLPPTASGSWSYIYDGIYRTQRRSQQRRRALARLLRRFREASEAIPDAAIVFRYDGSLIWCNKLGQFYFGLKWPADTGIRISNLIRHPKFIAYLQAGDFTDPIHLASPVREDLELEIRIMPYSDEQYLLMARDVTQIKQLENMRKDFVANVSHELKTPLTVISGYLELLEDQEQISSAMYNKAIAGMTKQSTRMHNLVEQLLSLSQLDTQQPDIFEHEVNVPAMLAEVKSEAERLNQDKKHKITFTIADQQIFGMKEELRSVFVNLVSNAIYYTPANGTIDVSWQPQGDGMEFSVTDSGPGIPAKHISRLTERFYRVDNARNSETGGTGLGLAIVKHALEKHHSQLLIESKIGQGSRFSFRISQELLIKKS